MAAIGNWKQLNDCWRDIALGYVLSGVFFNGGQVVNAGHLYKFKMAAGGTRKI